MQTVWPVAAARWQMVGVGQTGLGVNHRWATRLQQQQCAITADAVSHMACRPEEPQPPGGLQLHCQGGGL